MLSGILNYSSTEHNQLFIHNVECKLCFTTVNEGNKQLNFKLLRKICSLLKEEEDVNR